jgi:hypothetical protein
MTAAEWVAASPWLAIPPVFAAGYSFRWAVKHPGGRVDRMLDRLFGRWA